MTGTEKQESGEFCDSPTRHRSSLGPSHPNSPNNYDYGQVRGDQPPDAQRQSAIEFSLSLLHSDFVEIENAGLQVIVRQETGRLVIELPGVLLCPNCTMLAATQQCPMCQVQIM